jgi:5-methylthioadenosine/S-adenosylhomocysteine deaminase
LLDLLIKNGTLVTMNPKRTIQKNNIYIKDGIIVGIGSEDIPASKVIDAKNSVVLPGFVNCHTHLYQALIEGIGYDMHFEPWNWRFLFPIVSQMSPDHSYRSTRLASLEMIKTGTTTICDHWYMHTDFQNIREATKALDESGLRAKMIYGLLDKTFAGEELEEDKMTMIHSRDDLVIDFRDYYKQWHNKKNTTVAIGAGSTQDASEELLIESKKIADELNIQMCTHVAGWQDILACTYSRYGMRDVEFTHSRGITGENSVFIHTVWLTPEEISILAKSKTGSVHCPAANSQLGYGIAPVAEMLQSGVKVGLGTDGAGSYTYDMFELMRMTAYLQKQKHQSADALTAEQALEMATIKGAEVLGMDDQIGSIELGKKADLIIVDFQQPHLLLSNRIVAKLVYSAHGSDVKTTIIDGKVVMEQGEVKTINESEELVLAQQSLDELLEVAGDETARLLNAPWGAKRPYWRS